MYITVYICVHFGELWAWNLRGTLTEPRGTLRAHPRTPILALPKGPTPLGALPRTALSCGATHLGALVGPMQGLTLGAHNPNAL